MLDLLNPKEIEIDLPGGGTAKYILSDFPAVQGREIIAKYPTSALPKIGDYSVSEEIMLKLMDFVCVEKNGTLIRLGTRTLIDNHIASWEVLAKIEMAMMEKNCSFFRKGTLYASLAGIAETSLQKIIATLTPLLEQSSPRIKPPCTSSEPSTH